MCFSGFFRTDVKFNSYGGIIFYRFIIIVQKWVYILRKSFQFEILFVRLFSWHCSQRSHFRLLRRRGEKKERKSSILAVNEEKRQPRGETEVNEREKSIGNPFLILIVGMAERPEVSLKERFLRKQCEI